MAFTRPPHDKQIKAPPVKKAGAGTSTSTETR